MKQTYKLTKEQKEEICVRYLNGESTVQLGNAFNVTKANIRSLLITRNIPRRKNTAKLHRTYHCNHEYFNEPFDENRAYWVGFILADGNISDTKKTGANILSIGLKESDKHHLLKFLNDIESNHPIITSTAKNGYGAGFKNCKITIASEALTTSLKKYDVLPRKTGVHRTPNIPKNLLKHMYRGYVDGNGSIGIYQLRTWPNSSFECVGPYGFLKTFSDWLSKVVNTNRNQPTKINKTTTVQRLRYGGVSQVKSVVELLYVDSNIYLDRKYKLALELIKLQKQTNSHRRDDGLM